MKHQPRNCPVCLSDERRLLFRQQFSTFSEGSLMTGYDIALCNSCGAGYADDIPSQREFDTYYAEMSKYEYSQSEGLPGTIDQDRYPETVAITAPFIPRDASIADVGCATGGLLAEFKKQGFTNLTGFDPSRACADAARRLYDIEVKAASIYELRMIQDRFNAILLTGVLEHLRDVDESITALSGLLTPGGLLYIEVPDATRYCKWFSAPFQFFSMEHVNFFSPGSLANLLSRLGFDCLQTTRLNRFLGPRAVEPAIAAVFRLRSPSASPPPPPTPDVETGPALTVYIGQSAARDQQIHATIAQLAESRVPLAVWGAGTHTLRLLETSPLPTANLVAFIDSNSRYQGKSLHGIPIVGPGQFHNPTATILISSHAAESEIAESIRTRLQWPNPVVCLYGDAALDVPAGG
jgi:SAM-dependent methyltransferase